MGAQVQKPVIVPIGERKGWLEARKSVQDKGGLPSNVLHDDILVGLWPTLPDAEKAKLRGYYPAWAREVLVHPAKGDQFKKGKDVVDAHKDDAGREWVFPVSSMPEEAVGRAKVGLFVDPESVEVTGSRVVVLASPKNVVVLPSFIQENAQMGKVDERTRVPLEVAPEVAEMLTHDQKRLLYRINGVGVRPLVRVVFDLDGRDVFAYDDGLGGAFGVAYVGFDANVATATLRPLSEGQ